MALLSLGSCGGKCILCAKLHVGCVLLTCSWLQQANKGVRRVAVTNLEK